MPRFLFLTWNGAGNQPPAVATAQALRRRGHEITFAGYANQCSYFTERGLRFVLLGRSSAAWRDAAPEHMFAVKLRAVWATPDHLFDLPRLISEELYDAVVIDCLMFGALAAAESTHVPVATLIHSAPGALMPPKGRFESQVLGPVNELRAGAGLQRVGSLWESWARFPSLSNSIRQLDPLAAQAPAAFTYLGPIIEDLPPSGWQPPWQANDPRPLVLVSFSTGPYWDQTSRILRTLDAVRDRDCRALVTAGSIELDPAIVPDNATVVRRIPHDEILPHVAVTITHAGHGTVTASLKHGVPLLCLPNPAGDQPILAAQVQNLGCGLSLEGDTATSSEIGQAIDRLILAPSYAANARLLADAILRSPGISTAVSRLEELCAP
ncbi:glycosyltransferase family 1 protein [Bradyrhizobium diazoefficiens]|nr:glycosyltransferase [Bradyrhizobium diazoefficiens]QQO21423.1 glycosyltransferase family 1 protein [Bradyrhizobium diazoefficiens]